MHARTLAAALLLLSTPSVAHARVTIASTVQEIVEVTQADGSVRQARIAADSVTPGDVVVYTYRMSNGADTPAERVMVTAALAPELSLRLASVTADGFDVAYSADGGRSFGALAALRVRDVQGRQRQAQAGDVTHIRWTRRLALAAGAGDSCGFTALVR